MAFTDTPKYFSVRVDGLVIRLEYSNQPVLSFECHSEQEMGLLLKQLGHECLSVGIRVLNSTRGDLKFSYPDPTIDRCW